MASKELLAEFCVGPKFYLLARFKFAVQQAKSNTKYVQAEKFSEWCEAMTSEKTVIIIKNKRDLAKIELVFSGPSAPAMNNGLNWVQRVEGGCWKCAIWV